MFSQVPHCPTVAPMCAVTHWQCPPPMLSAYTHCPTVPPMCAVTHWQCPPQTMTTTVQPTAVCPPTNMLGCPATHTCPPTNAFGCPNTATCPPTNALGCPNTATCPPTNAFGCPSTSTCPPGNEGMAQQVGPTGVQGCTQSPAQCGNTAWPGCRIGVTGWQGCAPAQGGPVHPTVWTQLCPTSMMGCPNTATCGQENVAAMVGPTGVQGCTQSPAQCGNTAWQGCPIGQTGVQGCTQSPAQCGNTHWQGCMVGPTGVQGCVSPPAQAGNAAMTAATVCTQYSCPPTHLLGCTCLPMTVGPVMTVAGQC